MTNKSNNQSLPFSLPAKHSEENLEYKFDNYSLHPAFLKAEIHKLTVQRDRWQSTAAGLSQDLSNAEDQIQQLLEKINVMESTNKSDPKDSIVDIIFELSEAESIICSHLRESYESKFYDNKYCWHISFEQELKWLERSNLIKIISYDGEWITAQWTDASAFVLKEADLKNLNVEDRLSMLLEHPPEIFKDFSFEVENAIAEIKNLRKELDKATHDVRKYSQTILENRIDIQRLITLGNQMVKSLDSYQGEWRVPSKKTLKLFEDWEEAISRSSLS